MRDITCVSDDGEDILMKNVDLEDMYCTSAELLETDEDYSSDNGTTSAACLLLSRYYNTVHKNTTYVLWIYMQLRLMLIVLLVYLD